MLTPAALVGAQLAWEEGCVRLFLLLVSMSSATRNRVACLLGWPTVTKPSFGNAHAEAWEIISKDGDGMQGCCNQSWETLNPGGANCNYYDMLYRVGMHAMPDAKEELERRFKCPWAESLQRCQSNSDSHLRMMEDMLVCKMSQVNRARMNAEQREAMDKARAEKNEQYLKYAAQMAGCVADDRVKQYALDSVMVVYYGNAVLMGNTLIISTVGGAVAGMGSVGASVGGVITSAAFGTAVIGVGVLLLAGEVLHQTFGAALAKLHPAILAVLSQRLSLLVMGMEVEKFYPKQYGKGVALTDALGGAEGVRMIRKSVAADERIHLGEAVEQLQMKALEGGVENRIAKAEQVLDAKILPEVTTLLQKAKENEAIATAADDLVSTAQELYGKNTGVGLIKEIVAAPEQSLDASEVFNALSAAGGQMVGEAQALSAEEVAQLKERASGVLSQAKDVVGESEVARKLVARGQTLLDGRGGGAEGGESAPLLEKGRQMIEKGRGLGSAAEVLAMLREDAEFLDGVKATCLRYLEQTVTGVELPRIEGERDWGRYAISGLAVKGLAVGVDGLSLDVAEGVTIQVRDISIEFDTFDWEYKKSSFPSTSDAGRAATTVIDLCITVSFRIGASSSTMFAMQRCQDVRVHSQGRARRRGWRCATSARRST